MESSHAAPYAALAHLLSAWAIRIFAREDGCLTFAVLVHFAAAISLLVLSRSLPLVSALASCGLAASTFFNLVLAPRARPPRLDGRVVAITGSSSGIGEEVGGSSLQAGLVLSIGGGRLRPQETRHACSLRARALP